MAWTSPRTWVSGETVTASLANTHWRDNFNYLYDNRYGVGRRNAIINSHMDVWQRGTSFALSSSTKTYWPTGGPSTAPRQVAPYPARPARPGRRTPCAYSAIRATHQRRDHRVSRA